MYAISIKDLRNKMPFVRSELKKGTSFLIIFQSTPIGKLTPVDSGKEIDVINNEFKEVEAAAIADLDEDEYLTQKEIDHYMSLPPLSDK